MDVGVLARPRTGRRRIRAHRVPRTWRAGRRGRDARRRTPRRRSRTRVDEEARTRGGEPRERGRSSQTGIEHALVYWYRASRSGEFGYSKPWPRFWLKVFKINRRAGTSLRPRPDVQQIKSRQRIFQPIRTDVPPPSHSNPSELGHALLPGLDHRRANTSPSIFALCNERLSRPRRQTPCQPRQERPHRSPARRAPGYHPPLPDPGRRVLAEHSSRDAELSRWFDNWKTRRRRHFLVLGARLRVPAVVLCACLRARVPRCRWVPGSIPPLAAAPRHPPPLQPPMNPRPPAPARRGTRSRPGLPSRFARTRATAARAGRA